MNQRLNKGVTTRQMIVAAATGLFADVGYDATPVEAVLSTCGISRGALYHHFASKEALFEAVLNAAEADIMQATLAATRDITDPVVALRAGCDAFLAMAQTPLVRQIVLTDAPAVLGWHKWREIDARYGFGLIKAAIAAAAAQGRARPEHVDVLAHMLLAALMEVALLAARADNPTEALQVAKSAVGELIERQLPA